MAKFNWLKLRISVRKFIQFYKIKELRKINRDILFFENNSNIEILDILSKINKLDNFESELL